jgi:hypothetical protein
MGPTEFDALRDEMRTFIRGRVRGGFTPSDQIAAGAVDTFSDQADPDELEPVAARITQEEVAAHLRDQENWPAATDCDRLDDAFAELTEGGIVCRQDFTCCSTCGHSEIGGEMAIERQAGRRVRGYAFYHMQDTDRAVAGCGIYLKYGAVEQGDAAGQQIGREIEAALGRHGLKTSWNGRLDTSILVEVDWKRRRPREVLA